MLDLIYVDSTIIYVWELSKRIDLMPEAVMGRYEDVADQATQSTIDLMPEAVMGRYEDVADQATQPTTHSPQV